MNKRWNVSWKRVGLALLLIFALPWLVLLALYQLRPWLTAQEFARSYPWLNMVPAAPQDSALAPLTGVRVEFYGVSLQTPWKEIAKTHSYRGLSVVTFKDGVNMMVSDPAQDLDNAVLRQLRANHLLDDQALRSNYTLKAAEMAATSEQVKWWRPPRQNVKHLLPFTLKLASLPHAADLYSVNIGEFRGFQKGNPAVAPYDVAFDLFDGADRHYQIEFFGSDKHRPLLTQSEINAMVASLQAIDAN